MNATREDVHRWFAICELSLVTASAIWLVCKYREPLLLALPVAAFTLLATVLWADWLHQRGLRGADAVILLLVSGYDLLEWIHGNTTIGILVGLIVAAVLGRAIKRIIHPPSADEIAERELRRASLREKFEQKRKVNTSSENPTSKWFSAIFPWLCAAAYFFYPWHTSDFQGHNLHLALVLFGYLILRTIIIRRFPPANTKINIGQPNVLRQNGDSA